MDKKESLEFLERFAHKLDRKNLDVEADAVTHVMERIAIFNNLWQGENGLKAPVNPFENAYDTSYGSQLMVDKTDHIPGGGYHDNSTPDYGPIKQQKYMEGMTPQEVALRNQAMEQGSPMLERAKQEKAYQLGYHLQAFKESLNATPDNALRIQYYKNLISDTTNPMTPAQARSLAMSANRIDVVEALTAKEQELYNNEMSQLRANTSGMAAQNMNDEINNMSTLMPTV